MIPTKEKVLEALSNVQEPDLGKDLVSLNMIQNLVIKDDTVAFTIVLTTPACPMKDAMKQACENAIRLLVDKNIKTIVDFSSQKKDHSATAVTAMQGVKNIIAVFSGKGGVGKSTVSSNLAISLSQEGAKVGLMDADIYGPSIPMMFGIQGERPMMQQIGEKQMIVPIQKHGIAVMSIGLLIDDKQAVVWRGPMASSAIRQFITDVHWGDLDYLIIDMPPGTGDIHLSVLQLVPLSGAVIVTTPQDVALADAKKAIAMFAQAQSKVLIIGIIENMAYFTPEELPNNKYYIFGKDGGKHLATEFELPFLGTIPLSQNVREAGDNGNPISNVLSAPIMKTAFVTLTKNAIRSLSMHQQNIERTKIAQMMSE